jgi:GH35 family endo-1,4-beta-xylanase
MNHKDPTRAYLTLYNGVIEDHIIKDGYCTGEKIQQTKNPIQNVEEEYVEITINNQKYNISKNMIKKLKEKTRNVTILH